MKITSSKYSNGRYTTGGTVEQDGRYLGWWERTIMNSANDDITFQLTPKYNQRPDLLAFDKYGKESYMWLILQYNNILDITTEFITGATIVLPSSARSNSIVSSSTNRGIAI